MIQNSGLQLWSVVRIPTIEKEDLRRSRHHERSRLICERTAHTNRIIIPSSGACRINDSSPPVSILHKPFALGAVCDDSEL
jgi:hypothetical protein